MNGRTTEQESSKGWKDKGKRQSEGEGETEGGGSDKGREQVIEKEGNNENKR